MPAPIEILERTRTDLGELVLRTRQDLRLQRRVTEVLLNDEFLMSDAFTAGEIALTELGLASLAGPELSVVVGGLGLGYTAATAQADDRVGEVLVIEALPEVIRWHEQGLVEDADVRGCRLHEANFFAVAAGSEGFDPDVPGRVFDAILLDIDHSPRLTLAEDNAALYTVEGLRAMNRFLAPQGVFGLWSDEAPDEDFLPILEAVYVSVAAEVVEFPNPYTGGNSANTVYVCVGQREG